MGWVVFPTSFDKRPSHILEHLVGLVGGEVVARDLGTQAHPQRVQRVEGRILGMLSGAVLLVLPYGHIVTMGFVCRCGTGDEQQEGQKNGAVHGRTLTESGTRVKMS